MSQDTESKIMKPYLSFKLANQLFAMDVNTVIEILEVPKITVVPKAPPFMKGVINLRGLVLPVVDTCVKFGLPPITIKDQTCVIVIEVIINDEKIKVGALVEYVFDVLKLSDTDLLPSPSIEAKYNVDFIRGIFNIDGEFMMVLNMDKVFSIDEINFMQESEE